MEIKPERKKRAFKTLQEGREKIQAVRKAFGLSEKDQLNSDTILPLMDAMLEEAKQAEGAASHIWPDVSEAYLKYGGNMQKFKGSLSQTQAKKKPEPATAEPLNPPKK